MKGPQTAVERLVSGVLEACEGDLSKRRDVLQEHLARLTVPQKEQLAWRDGLDIVGSAYERLFSGDERRDAGQFFTPFWAGEVMAGWAFEQQADVALDPGAGSGGLLIPAARHPKRNGTRLIGLDRDPLAVAMLDTNIRLRGLDGVKAKQGDFLLDELGFEPGAITCNPPYSRHHAIPATEKEAIHDGFAERLGIRFNGLAALHVLFLVRAIEVAADGARIAFITPSDWLDVGYGRAIKHWLLQRAQVEAIVLLEESHLFFDGVLTTAAITLIRKGPPTAEKTKILRIAGDPTRFKAKQITDLLADRAKLDELPIERVDLAKQDKWSRPNAKRRSGKALGSVARVRRGIATGSNSFFVISEAQRRKLGIPPEELKRCITSPRAFSGTELTAEAMDAFPDDVPRWLVDCGDAGEIERDSPLGRYLRRGRRLGIHRGYLAAKRNPWHRLEQRPTTPILFTYFNRDAPRFVRNLAAAVPLNNWLIIEPREGVDPDALHKALTSRSVREQLDERRRVYGGGLWKLEPSELVEVRVRL